MIWSIFLFAFLNYYSGVSSQPAWIQPTSLSVSLGQTIKISCTVSGTVNTISWYQQRSGQVPRYVHYSGGSRGDGIPDRFTASVSGSIGYLTITGVQTEDEANYYCAMWHSSASSSYVFGGGTSLTVTGQPTVSPSVQLFAPSLEEIRGPNPYTLVCVVTGFYPPGFNLQWKCDDKVITSGVETTKASKQGVNYIASSYMKQSASAYENCDIFTCKVTHEGKTIEKRVSKSGGC